MGPQRREKNPSISLKVTRNMSKLVARGYIMEEVILSLTSFFYVSKVTYDICMVFDATVSGINDYLWDPNFMFPSMVSLLMMVGLEMHIVDLDAGEMFYNFKLSSILTKCCEVDLGYYLGNKKDRQGTPLYMILVRLMMGLVLFTYSEI